MLDRLGHVKLSDFGLCKAFGGTPLPYLDQYKEESKKDEEGHDHQQKANEKSKQWKQRNTRQLVCVVHIMFSF